jgi:MYXO-CTERM domain-containing protein
MILAVAACLAGGVGAYASPITYDVDQSIGSGSVVGTIETDGVTGVLNVSDILSYDLVLTGAGGVTNELTNTNSAFTNFGSDVTATSQAILYDYNAEDAGYLSVQQNGYLYSGYYYWCNAAAGDFACAEGASVVPGSYADPSAQYEPRTGVQSIATAVSSAPEPSAWALMIAGLGAIGLLLRRANNGVRFGASSAAAV